MCCGKLSLDLHVLIGRISRANARFLSSHIYILTQLRSTVNLRLSVFPLTCVHKNELLSRYINACDYNEQVDSNPACKQAEWTRATEPSQNTRPLLCSLCALLTIRPRLEHKFDNGPEFLFWTACRSSTIFRSLSPLLSARLYENWEFLQRLT